MALLERRLRDGRLADIARRPAPAYDGATTLQLIRAGRESELLATTRASLSWSVGA